jgi:membrane-bound inhibitor of C-type lysozyme
MRPTSLTLAIAAVIVSGWATTAAADQPADAWRQVAYSCESGQPLTVAYRDSGSSVKVTVADRPAVKLNARPANAGFRYGDSRHELRGEGNQVMWTTGTRTPVKCTSEDPAVANLAAAANR